MPRRDAAVAPPCADGRAIVDKHTLQSSPAWRRGEAGEQPTMSTKNATLVQGAFHRHRGKRNAVGLSPKEDCPARFPLPRRDLGEQFHLHEMGRRRDITGADRVAARRLRFSASLSLCAFATDATLAARPTRSPLHRHVTSGHDHLLLCLRQRHGPSSIEHCRPAKWRDPPVYFRLHVAISERRAHQYTEGNGRCPGLPRRAADRSSVGGPR